MRFVDSLSAFHREVFRLYVEGKHRVEIAEQLQRNLDSVENSIKVIFRKCGIRGHAGHSGKKREALLRYLADEAAGKAVRQVAKVEKVDPGPSSRIRCLVLEVELPRLDHDCGPDCVCFVSRTPDPPENDAVTLLPLRHRHRRVIR